MNTYIIYQPEAVKADAELEFCKNFIDLNNGQILKIYQDDISRTQLKLLVSEIDKNMLGTIHHFLSFSETHIPHEQNIRNIIHELLLRKHIQITYLKQNISTNNPSGMLSVLSKYYGSLYDQRHLNYFEFLGLISNQVTKIYNTASENNFCECTICGWRGMRFNATFYKDGFRENLICECCESWGRHRRVWGLLQDGGYLKNGITILDTAPMKQLSHKIQQSDVSYTSIDIETKRKPSIQGDLTTIPFKEKTFDLVLSMQVLEHIMDDKKALQNLISVTKDSGTLIISVPYNKKPGSVTREYGAPNWDEFGHVREYGMDVLERFKKEGLHIEECVWGEDKNKLALLQLGIDPSEKEVFFICKKHLGHNNQRASNSSEDRSVDHSLQRDPRQLESKKLMTLIIPTFNRAETLEKTLRAYNNQTVSPNSFEILIVDDGSTDDTKDVVYRLQHEVNYTLNYHYQHNQGPGQARNWGIRNSTTEYIFITGDDIIPGQNLIWEHIKTHISDPRDNIVVLGHVDWPPEIPMNPLMYYLTEHTATQFGFHQIQDTENAGYEFFYTSNISLKTSFLKNKDLFNPIFPHAAYEDIELGYRLQMQGMIMKYNKDALGYHDHMMTYDATSKRQHKCGQMAVVFTQLHPNLEGVTDGFNLNYDEAQHRQILNQLEDLNTELAKSNFKELIKKNLSDISDQQKTTLNKIFSFAFTLHFRLGFLDFLKEAQSHDQKLVSV